MWFRVSENEVAGSEQFRISSHGYGLVGAATWLRPEHPMRNRGLILGRGQRFVCPPKPPDLLWDPPSLPFNV